MPYRHWYSTNMVTYSNKEGCRAVDIKICNECANTSYTYQALLSVCIRSRIIHVKYIFPHSSCLMTYTTADTNVGPPSGSKHLLSKAREGRWTIVIVPLPFCTIYNHAIKRKAQEGPVDMKGSGTLV